MRQTYQTVTPQGKKKNSLRYVLQGQPQQLEMFSPNAGIVEDCRIIWDGSCLDCRRCLPVQS